MEKLDSSEPFHGFDSQWYVETLEKSGIPPAQSKAHLQASKEVMMNIFANVVSKQDFLLFKQEMRSELKLLHWAIYLVIGMLTPSFFKTMVGLFH